MFGRILLNSFELGPICSKLYTIELNGKSDNKFDKNRIDYSKEFFDTCQRLNADYAIPFASNMACLHKETFKYNKILNFSDYVFNDFKTSLGSIDSMQYCFSL